MKQSQTMALLTSSQNQEWRTPARYIEAARLVMGGIDLDPASTALANQTVKAARFYTKEQDGLSLPWFGRVWLNPPYGKTGSQSSQGLFAQKLVEDYEAGRVEQAILLINFYFGYRWFDPLRTRPTCFVDHLIRFIHPVTGSEEKPAKASSVFIYFGPDVRRFYQTFSEFGFCATPWKELAA